MPSESEKITVGELVARFLEAYGVRAAFGVISIHNMPILDAIGKRGKTRFVPARGEAGALNMADAFARVTNSLGAAFTSTGTAAGNAAGAMVEATTAGSPVLHVTGQIETKHIGRDRAYIHEAPAQAEMLSAVSKAVYTIMTPHEALHVLQQAAREALTAPRGPVSIEIPIDVQQSMIDSPKSISLWPVEPASADAAGVAKLVEQVRSAKRPMLLLGGGARGASSEATRLATLGFGIVTSTNGRAVVAEDTSHSLGAFNVGIEVESVYSDCDLLVVVGSRLRGNETWTYKLKLPTNIAVVDVDPRADGRVYRNAHFVRGDSRHVLGELADQLEGVFKPDPAFLNKIEAAKASMVDKVRTGLGPYSRLVDDLQRQMPADALWVRDVTISNSMWGNRYLTIGGPYNSVHALGGGIGQGMPMAVGAATGANARKTVLLTGDGGFCLCLGELFTAADENSNITILMMNDAGYGVIRNIQDDKYGERHYFSNLQMPDFSKVCDSIGMKHHRVESLDVFAEALEESLSFDGPSMVEIDMTKIGPYTAKFAGPPTTNRH